MKINVERLIGAVQESFDNANSYRLCFVAKKWYQMDEKERAHANWCERNEHGSINEVSDLCAILNIDCSNLYTIARLARKWEAKHKWELCFPAESHSEAIIKYLSPADPFTGPYTNYINWNINHKAEKSSKKAA